MIVAGFAATYIALRPHLKISWKAVPIGKSVLAALIVGTPLFLLDSWLRFAGLPRLAVAVLDLALFLPSALACLRLLKILNREDLELLPNQLRRLIKILG